MFFAPVFSDSTQRSQPRSSNISQLPVGNQEGLGSLHIGLSHGDAEEQRKSAGTAVFC